MTILKIYLNKILQVRNKLIFLYIYYYSHSCTRCQQVFHCIYFVYKYTEITSNPQCSKTIKNNPVIQIIH